MNGSELVKHQTKLAIKAKAGDKRALAELFRAMQPYVVDMRRRFASDQLDREDVEQACRLGILRALQDFDPAKGSIGAISAAWMREEIRKLSDLTLRPVRLPQSRPLKKVQWQVLPRVRKLMAGGMDEESAQIQATEEAGVSMDELRGFLASRQTVPIGARVADHDSTEKMGEHFEPSHEPDPLNDMAEDDRRYALQIVESSVSAKDWDVLTARMFRDETFEVIGARYGVTKERARHLFREAVARAAQALDQEGLGPEALL